MIKMTMMSHSTEKGRKDFARRIQRNKKPPKLEKVISQITINADVSKEWWRKVAKSFSRCLARVWLKLVQYVWMIVTHKPRLHQMLARMYTVTSAYFSGRNPARTHARNASKKLQKFTIITVKAGKKSNALKKRNRMFHIKKCILNAKIVIKGSPIEIQLVQDQTKQICVNVRTKQFTKDV